jgi:hypothetical protein
VLLVCPSKKDVALKLQFDKNPIIINHKFNGDLRATSFLEGHKRDL